MLIEYHPQVECDLEETAAYYTRRNPHAAHRFLDAFNDAARFVGQFPRASREDHGLRRKRIGRFPYAIVYRILGETAQVLVVENLMRRSGYWHERLQDPPTTS